MLTRLNQHTRFLHQPHENENVRVRSTASQVSGDKRVDLGFIRINNEAKVFDRGKIQYAWQCVYCM